MSTLEELVSTVMRTEGVKGCIVTTADGQVELAEGIEQVEAVSSSIALAMMNSVSIGVHLGASKLRYLVFFTKGRQDVIVMAAGENFLGVVKQAGASLGDVVTGVRHALGELARKA